MSIESPEDLAQLRRIGRIVAMTAREMARRVAPGITTAELDAIGQAYLQQAGARSAPRLAYNFPGATCISINDQAAHGVPGPRVVAAGDLVNIDVSAELNGYFADTALMVPVPPISATARKLCHGVEAALRRAMAVARAGEPINSIGRAIESEARRGGFEVLYELGGHGVGRHIHEEPRDIASFYNARDRRRLTPGLVITIEPFLTTGARRVVQDRDGWTLRTSDGSLSAQCEHTIVITRGAPIVITAL